MPLIAAAAMVAALSQPIALPHLPVQDAGSSAGSGWKTAHSTEASALGWKDVLGWSLEAALPLDPPKDGEVVGTVTYPAPPPGESATERWRALICSYNWPCGQAMAVMTCESRGNPQAYSAGNWGLFQINTVHAWRVGGDPRVFWNPETNVRVAHDIWSEHLPNGWGPWGCRP